MFEYKKQDNEILSFNTINTDGKIYLPLTPSEWTGRTNYTPLTAVLMMAEKGRTQALLLRDPMYRLLTSGGAMIQVETWDGRPICLNPQYMIGAERVMMVTRKLKHGHHGYPKGPLICRALVPEGRKAEFVNQFRMWE